MPSPSELKYSFSRRAFLQGMRWTPLLFLPAPLHSFVSDASQPPILDYRVTPHYPTKFPLDDVLRYVTPGLDGYPTEKYAYEISALLEECSRALRAESPGVNTLGILALSTIEVSGFGPAKDTPLRSSNGIEVLRRQFAESLVSGRERFLAMMKGHLASFSHLDTAEFQMVGIRESGTNLDVEIRYDLIGVTREKLREGRFGTWSTKWSKDGLGAWRMSRLQATEEIVTRARGPLFVDVTSQALGQTESYRNQLAHGADYWRTILDGAIGVDVYGNNGIAAADFDNTGHDSLYVCQSAGLPNRLYRNRGDGSFEDVTEKAGVGVLDNTACALFADFENKGLQDLLVVCGSGPLLFLNQGNGKFALKRDAFKFAQPPQGSFTHAAIADYDNDGRLDIYFCLYSYYLGLDQYHYPAPYYDARNGPPNFLFHNQGNATFEDRTEASGLNTENNRYSFSCAWGNSGSGGAPDLYVANDFGRSNLYKNKGDGTFAVDSKEAGVEDPGAGMSACWFDSDVEGRQDIYVANMWSADGIRVSEQDDFRKSDSPETRALYRQHARGNSLYRNQGDGTFKNVSQEAGVEMGRWAWSSDAWDFDHDGHSDLYVANGYITGDDPREVSSFFWRQVVANSPATPTPSIPYEEGWNAINELIRSDASWSGRERNVLYANNGDGTFTDVSGVIGLDFPDDSRAFALADLDHDGRLEIILKNRNAPQLRILHNAMTEIGNSITFRLRGTKSNRDAIGTSITIDKQTKYLQAGSGFLSQHTKELFFGVGNHADSLSATVHWPRGLTQTFAELPINHRIEIVEGATTFSAKPFGATPYAQPGDPQKSETLPATVETWLIDPLPAPDFSLPDSQGKTQSLQSFRGQFLLLAFCRKTTVDQLRPLKNILGLRVLVLNVDEPVPTKLPFSIVQATPEVTGIYNIIYRYLFDRRRDLGVPTSFLVNAEGMIVKVYQGSVNPQQLSEDIKSAPRTSVERSTKALPFPGTLYQSAFQRNQFTYGIAMFQRGYLDQAVASFKQVIATKPNDPEAYYNLGTLELRRNNLTEARGYLEQTVKLKQNYPEAWNNLGMTAAQEGHNEEALHNLQQSIELRPSYTVALLNLGNLQRRLGAMAEAQQTLTRAVELEPENPETNYGLGMLYARQNGLDRATQLLEKSIALRPDYADAINNLGVLHVRQKNLAAAEEDFKKCIEVAPNYDQGYLNLARVYVLLDDKVNAREALRLLLVRQPENQTAQKALETLN
ncbi:MAG TPA: FG-GAP-like repeat-containing protein [Terriglobales bacterium]|nr:FG-GAP-like repeat-containing protein [Terriglobales bacterium]